MRKGVLVVGIVLLVVGVAMVGGSLFETDHALSGLLNPSRGMGDTMNSNRNGEFYSTVLNATPGNYIMVTSGAPHYLIPSDDLSVVNSSNVGAYAVSAYQTSGNNTLYTSLNGSYYVVVFGPAPPIVGYDVIASITGLVWSVAVLGLGVIFAIAGLIVAVIGAILKPKRLPRVPL